MKKSIYYFLFFIVGFIGPMHQDINLEEAKSRPKRSRNENVVEEDILTSKKQKIAERSEAPIHIAFKNDVGEITAIREITREQLEMLKAISTVIHDAVGLISTDIIPIYGLNVDNFDKFFPFVELVYYLKTTKEEDYNKIKQEIETKVNTLSSPEQLNILKAADYLIVPLFEDILIDGIAQSIQKHEQLEMFINNNQKWQKEYEAIASHYYMQKKIVQSMLQSHYFTLLQPLQLNHMKADIESTVESVAWSPDGTKLASGSDDGIVRIWDDSELLNMNDNRSVVESVAWSPDGTKLASGSDDGIVRIWDSATGKLINLNGHTSSISSVAWSPDGIKLASGSSDRTIRVWDSITGNVLYVLENSTVINSVAWSPNGERIAVGGNKIISIWNSTTQTLLKTLTSANDVISIAWSPDGSKIAGSNNKTINIFDSITGQSLKILEGHEGIITSVAWSPNGKMLVSGSYDKTVRIWDSITGQALKLVNEDRTIQDAAGQIWSVAWNFKTAQLASGSFKGIISVWDITPLMEFVDILNQLDLEQAEFIVAVLAGNLWKNNETMIAIFDTLPTIIKNNPLFQ